MDIELVNQPGNTAAKVTLYPGETCTAESGAMIAMSADLAVATTTHKKNSGGVMKTIKRLAAGESIFLNHFSCEQQQGELWLGATLAGDMAVVTLDNEKLIVQGGSFLACEHSLDIDMSWQGFKTLFAGERVFWLGISGQGQLILNSFGAIYPMAVDGELIVDTGHIVAFEETLNFTVSKAGSSWLHSFLGGEGLVCRFKGRGTVWCQSHNPQGFGRALTSNLRPRRI